MVEPNCKLPCQSFYSFIHSSIHTFLHYCTCGRCLGENVRMEIFEKTGHVPQMEDPARFNKFVTTKASFDSTARFVEVQLAKLVQLTAKSNQ